MGVDIAGSSVPGGRCDGAAPAGTGRLRPSRTRHIRTCRAGKLLLSLRGRIDPRQPQVLPMARLRRARGE